MKKILSSFLLIFLFLIPTQVFAVDFSIEKTDIHAVLKPNGQVQINEIHTYEFDGEFNGITRTLIPKRTSEITNVQASEDGTDLKITQEGNLYKIYRGAPMKP